MKLRMILFAFILAGLPFESKTGTYFPLTSLTKEIAKDRYIGVNEAIPTDYVAQYFQATLYLVHELCKRGPVTAQMRAQTCHQCMINGGNQSIGSLSRQGQKSRSLKIIWKSAPLIDRCLQMAWPLYQSVVTQHRLDGRDVGNLGAASRGTQPMDILHVFLGSHQGRLREAAFTRNGTMFQRKFPAQGKNSHECNFELNLNKCLESVWSPYA